MPARSQFSQQHLHPSGAPSQPATLDEINLCGMDAELSLPKEPQLPKKLSAHFEAEAKANPNKSSTISLASSGMLEDLHKTTTDFSSDSCRLSRRVGERSLSLTALFIHRPNGKSLCSALRALSRATPPRRSSASFPSRQPHLQAVPLSLLLPQPTPILSTPGLDSGVAWRSMLSSS